MPKHRENILLQLKQDGLTYSQIATRVGFREGFVRAFFAKLNLSPPTKPNGRRYAYQREALEVTLQRREREAFVIQRDITRLKERIEQVSSLEQSRQKLQQALK